MTQVSSGSRLIKLLSYTSLAGQLRCTDLAAYLCVTVSVMFERDMLFLYSLNKRILTVHLGDSQTVSDLRTGETKAKT